MKDLIIHGFKVLGIKIAVCFITVCLMIAFTWLFELPGGFRIYSVIMIILLCGWVFSTATVHGRKLYSRSRSPLCGLVCGFLAEIPTIAVIICSYIFKSSFMYFNVAYFALNAPYTGLIRPDAKILQMTALSGWSIALILLVPVVYFIGYALGQRGYEPSGMLVHKMVYKDKGGEDNGKGK